MHYGDFLQSHAQSNKDLNCNFFKSNPSRSRRKNQNHPYMSNLDASVSQAAGRSQQATASTLLHMTEARKKAPQGQVPPVKLATYQLSLRSSVSKANDGKIEKLGTFVDRAEAIQTKSSTSNYFTHVFHQIPSAKPTQQGWYSNIHPHTRDPQQQRGRSHFEQKERSTQPSILSSGLSSANIQASKNIRHQYASTKTMPSFGHKNFVQNRQKSALILKQQKTSSLQKLQVVPDKREKGSSFPIVDYGAPSQDFETSCDTKQLLGKYLAQRRSQTRAQSRREATKEAQVKVICSSESNDERIKLVVVQSSFKDVIQALYSNERADESTQRSNADENYNAARKDSTADKDNFSSKERTKESARDSHEKKSVADDVAQMLPKHIGQIPAAQGQLSGEKNLLKTHESGRDTQKGSDVGVREIKMMDTITFVAGFQPVHWIFTDLNGKIQSKELSQISVNEVIKAFLINLSSSNKGDFGNDDLMQFLDKQQIEQKICFAIKGQKRDLLDIKDLLELREKYPKGIDALQLFKIPTRTFLPFYFHHILAFDQLGRPLRSTLIRLPIKEVQMMMNAAQLQACMTGLRERSQSIQNRIQQVSNDVVSRLTEVSPVVLLNIIIVYLLEECNFEPWFIGTEKCEVLTQKITHKRRPAKRQFFKQPTDQPKAERKYRLKSNHLEANSRTRQNLKFQTGPTDPPEKIEIVESDIINTVELTKVNKGGRTPSTMTVFQKLDSRSHVTSQKNAEGDSDNQKVTMTGREASANKKNNMLTNDDPHDVDCVPVEIPINRMAGQIDKLANGQERKLGNGLTRRVVRPHTQVLTNDQWSREKIHQAVHNYSASQLVNAGDLVQPLIETDQCGAEYAESRIGQSQGLHSSMPKLFTQEHRPSELYDLQRNGSYVDKASLPVHQFRSLKPSEKTEANYSATKSHVYQQLPQGQAQNEENLLTMGGLSGGQQPDIADDFQQMLKNKTFIENLREVVLFQPEEVSEDLNATQINENARQRGKSAIQFRARPRQGSFSDENAIASDVTINIALNNDHKRQNVYLLQSNELISENELFAGLAKIGQQYGRTCYNTAKEPLYNHTKTHVRLGKPAQRGHALKMRNASRIKAFLERQEQFKLMSDENKAQHMVPKSTDNRLLSLFPQYLEKSASKFHSKFLFGDSEQVNVFRNFRNAMRSFEHKVKNLGDCMLPQEIIKNEVKMFTMAQQNLMGKRVFDIKMSDTDELRFLEDIVNKTAAPAETTGTRIDQCHFNNQDLASLSSMEAGSDVVNLSMLMQSPKKDERAKKESDLTRQSRKGRDFLAEMLEESRKVFQLQKNKRAILNHMDESALTMIEAQKRLEGVIVSDPDKVIHDFKNNKLFRRARDEDEYDLLGGVPLVKNELAQRYIEMKETIRRRELFERAQRKTLRSAQRQNVLTRKNTKNRAYKTQQNFKQRPGASNLPVVNGDPRSLRNAQAGDKQSAARVLDHKNDSVDQAALHTQNSMQEAVVSRVDLGPIAGFQSNEEDVYHQKRSESSLPQSLDTINQGQSQRQTGHEDPVFVKCDLGLFCSDSRILLSQEMSVEDICYIQDSDLARTREYLLSEENFVGVLTRYQRQFQGPKPVIKDAPPASEQSQVRKLKKTQFSEDPSLRDIAVGQSDALIDLKDSFIGQKQSSQESQAVSASGRESEDTEEEAMSMVYRNEDSTGQRIANSLLFQQTNQVELHQQIESTLPNAYACQQTDMKEFKRDFGESLVAGGMGQTKRGEAEKANTSATNSISYTNAAASYILKPLEEFCVKSQHIFKHEKLEAKQRASQREGHTETKAEASRRQSRAETKEALEETAAPSHDQHLQYLGIRHVQLDREHWVPSPELVPCCVRCFSIATYVLNYEPLSVVHPSRAATD